MALHLQAFALALWFGGGLSMLYGTRAVFAVAESRRQAGHFSGAILLGFRWLQLAAAILFVAAAFSGLPRASVVAGEVALFCTIVGFVVDRWLRALREEIGGSTEGLDPSDPRRKRWGALHGASVTLLIGQVLAAAVGLLVQ